MKINISRVLGILATLATVTGLFVGGATPVSAGIQAWTNITPPAVDPAIKWDGPMAEATDGTVYLASAYDDADADADDGVFIWKSIDFGSTWNKLTSPFFSFNGGNPRGVPSGIEGVGTDGQAAIMPLITSIVCSTTNANIVYCSDGYDIFKSGDAGLTWSALANPFVTLGYTPGLDNDGYIVSIDVGYSGGSTFVFAATSTCGHSESGHALAARESINLNPWTDLGIATDRFTPWVGGVDVLAIKCSTDFASSQAIVAVVTAYNYDYRINQLGSFINRTATSGPQTLVTTKYGSSQWAASASDVALAFTAGPKYYAVDATLDGATLWLPSDFSSNTASGRAVAFVGINPLDTPGTAGVLTGDVYKCSFTAASPAGQAAVGVDLNINGPNQAASIADLSGRGSIANAAILACGAAGDQPVPFGRVDTWATVNGGNNWSKDLKRPTGLVPGFFNGDFSSRLNFAACVVDIDFAVSGAALVGTRGTDCGVSYSRDYGASWDTVGMISTGIDRIGDLSLASDNTIYMTTRFTRDFAALPGEAADVLTISAKTTVITPGVYNTADAVTLTKTNSTGLLVTEIIVKAGSVGAALGGADSAFCSIIWTAGNGSHIGDRAVVTLDSTGDTAVFTARAHGTIFTAGINNPVLGSYTLSVSNDQAPYNNGAHQVLISGSNNNLYTVQLPDEAALFMATPPVTATDTEHIKLQVLSGGSVTVSGTVPAPPATNGDGTYAPAPGTELDFVLNPGYPVMTVQLTDTNQASGIEIAQDAGAGTASYAINGLGYGQVPAGATFSPITLNAVTLPTELQTVEYYSAWRYLDGYWARINSWSLNAVLARTVGPGTIILLPTLDMDYQRTTADNAALFIIDKDSLKIYRSIDWGQTWVRLNVSFRPAFQAGEAIMSVLVRDPYSLILGGQFGEIYLTTDASSYRLIQVFPANNDNIDITDIRSAANNDLLVAGASRKNAGLDNGGTIYNNHTIWVARSTAGSNYLAWAAVNTNAPTAPVAIGDSGGLAFIAPADDYATSGVVYVASNAVSVSSSNGIVNNTYGLWWGTITAGCIWQAVDEDADWYKVSGIAIGGHISPDIESVAGGMNATAGMPALQTASGLGITDEGRGMIYGVTTDGVARGRGRAALTTVSRLELIREPDATNPAFTTLTGLWLGSASAGAVTLFSIGDDNNIWTYTDTLNVAVSGLAAADIQTDSQTCQSCPPYSSSASLTWKALANADAYFLIVDTTPWTNFYDAFTGTVEYSRLTGLVSPVTYFSIITPSYGTTVSVQLKNLQFPQHDLAAGTVYYASVWAIRYPFNLYSSGTDILENAETFEQNAITTFGTGITFTTPPGTPTALAPAPAAIDVPTTPAFQWAAYPGAISYSLQVSTQANFGTLVVPTPVTVTGTAYAWTGPGLDYGTNYYWRLKASTTSGDSQWVMGVFTTVAAPFTSPPRVTVVPPSAALQPNPTLTVAMPAITVSIPPVAAPTVILPAISVPSYPTPTIVIPALNVQVPTATTPFYVWIIIGLGIVLAVAVIILVISSPKKPAAKK